MDEPLDAPVPALDEPAAAYLANCDPGDETQEERRLERDEQLAA